MPPAPQLADEQSKARTWSKAPISSHQAHKAKKSSLASEWKPLPQYRASQVQLKMGRPNSWAGRGANSKALLVAGINGCQPASKWVAALFLRRRSTIHTGLAYPPSPSLLPPYIPFPCDLPPPRSPVGFRVRAPSQWLHWSQGGFEFETPPKGCGFPPNIRVKRWRREVYRCFRLVVVSRHLVA